MTFQSSGTSGVPDTLRRETLKTAGAIALVAMGSQGFAQTAPPPVVIELLQYRDAGQPMGNGDSFAEPHDHMSPAYPRSMHICFHIRDDAFHARRRARAS